MKQLMVNGEGQVALHDAVDPVLDNQPPGAIVRTTHVVIGAGSTLGHVLSRRQQPDPQSKPKPISYQCAGIVEAVTPGITHLAPGDAVCCTGAGFAYNAERFFAPVHVLARLSGPEHLAAGACVNLAVTGLHACRRVRSTLGEWNVVVGLGMVGQFTAQFAALFGARVIGTDIQPLRLEKAKACGTAHALNARDPEIVNTIQSLTGGHGADAVLIAAKSDDDKLFEQANAMVNPESGRIALIGHFPVGRATGVDVDLMICGGCGYGWRDMTYKREGVAYPRNLVRWTVDRNIQLYADLLAEGRIQAEELITHRFPVSEANAAYTQLIEHGAETLGVLIEFS